MLILLIPFVLILLFLNFLGSSPHGNNRDAHWQKYALLALAVFGVFVVGIRKLLSAYEAINRLWIAASWLLILSAELYAGLRYKWLQEGWWRVK